MSISLFPRRPTRRLSLVACDCPPHCVVVSSIDLQKRRATSVSAGEHRKKERSAVAAEAGLAGEMRRGAFRARRTSVEEPCSVSGF